MYPPASLSVGNLLSYSSGRCLNRKPRNAVQCACRGGNTSILVRINRSRVVRNGNVEERDPCLVAGKHVLDLLVRQGDLLDGLALVLQRRIVVIDIRGQEELGIPFKALAGGKIRDLLQKATVSSRSRGDSARCRMLLTSRGGPSSSPMLIVVDLDSERAEPEGEHILVQSTRPSYDVTRGRWG